MLKINRELGKIESSLQRAHRMGRFLGIVFAVAAAFFVVLALFLLISLAQQPSSGDAAAVWIGAVYALVQDVVMGASFALCALVARDMAKGATPFSEKQIRRVLASGWLMVGFTLFCLFWDPLVSALSFSFSGFEFGVFASDQVGGLNLNFETLIAAGAFFLFAYILSYGKTLQELADEAL